MANFSDRLQHAWNAFMNKDPTPQRYSGAVYSSRPDRVRIMPGNERTILSAIMTRIAIDVASVDIFHVRLDDNGRYKETIKSSLNNALTVEANIDQTGRAFIFDLVLSMLDEGSIAAVPVITDDNPIFEDSFGITELRVGKIIEWYPSAVRLEVYNEANAKKEQLILPKKMVAIIENPLYAVMNEQNSTLRRLIRKLAMLDAIDEQSSSGKLDLVIQLPYPVKSEAKREFANSRRNEIERQLTNTKYGIAYIDATEHITQLNRPVENNLMSQIEYLTTTLYSQLSLTEEVIKGTADEKVMLNYYNRTIEPILSAITDEFKRKFLTKTARSQKQSIIFLRNPFKLVPVENIADIADKFTRNEILSSNEVRGIIGFKPVDDPQADALRNKNLNAGDGQEYATTDGERVSMTVPQEPTE